MSEAARSRIGAEASPAVTRFVALGDAMFRSGNDLPLPDPAANPACIGAWWDDLDVTSTDSVRYQAFGDHVVIQ